MRFLQIYRNVFFKTSVLIGIFLLSGIFFAYAPEEHKNFKRSGASINTLHRLTDAPLLDISAESVLVKRLITGEVLFERSKSVRFSPASISKLMTAFLLFGYSEPLTLISMPSEAKEILEKDEKRSLVPSEEIIKAEDLLKLIVVESDNDAAYAAAAYSAVKVEPALEVASFAERVQKFVALMNEKKDALGLLNTHFANPNGRDALDHYSTAEDLTHLAEVIYRTSPQIWDTSRLLWGEIYSKEKNGYRFKNTNALMLEFPAIYGSKTGFTDEAGGALLMLYELKAGDPIIVVILKSKDRFQDGRRILRWLDASFRVI